MSKDLWNERYSERDLVWSEKPNQFLVSEVEGLASGRALDLGCGEGRNAVWLAEMGWTVTAVDFSEIGIEKGRAIAAARGVAVDWVVADLTEFEPEAGSFDLVIDFYIHLPSDQRRGLTRKAADAVAPGGVVLIVGHDLTNLADGYGGPQDFAILHSPETISPALSPLNVVKAERIKRIVENDEGRFEAIDSLVRAEAPSAD